MDTQTKPWVVFVGPRKLNNRTQRRHYSTHAIVNPGNTPGGGDGRAQKTVKRREL